jgi:hypothetical protein
LERKEARVLNIKSEIFNFVAIMSNAEESSTTRQLQPPYGSVMWYDAFFKLLERIQIDKVDSAFLKTNEIAVGNEYKVINGLRFLGLIDSDGNATDRMKKDLRVVGEEYTKNFEKMVRDAYSVLITKVDLQKALADDVVNKLITEYNMARSTASQGAKIFAFLAQKAGIPISESLAQIREPEREVTREKRKTEEKKEGIKKVGRDVKESKVEGMHKIEWGNTILIYLKESENKEEKQKIANQAKKLIDMYSEE